MFEVTKEEKEFTLNSVEYFADMFFACQCGKVFIKLLAEVMQAKTPDSGIFWNDSLYCDKEDFKEVVEKIIYEVCRE